MRQLASDSLCCSGNDWLVVRRGCGSSVHAGNRATAAAGRCDNLADSLGNGCGRNFHGVVDGLKELPEKARAFGLCVGDDLLEFCRCQWQLVCRVVRGRGIGRRANLRWFAR